MVRTLGLFRIGLLASLVALALPAHAQSFRVQCPDTSASAAATAAANGPSLPTIGAGGTVLHPFVAGKAANPNGDIKCQQVFGTDGYATMADGNQIYLFGFGPGSGLDLVAQGLPGTQLAADFNQVFNSQFLADGATPDPTYTGVT